MLPQPWRPSSDTQIQSSRMIGHQSSCHKRCTSRVGPANSMSSPNVFAHQRMIYSSCQQTVYPFRQQTTHYSSCQQTQFLSPANNVPLASCCALVTNTHTHTHTSCIGGLTRTQIAEVLNLAGAVLGVEAAVVFGGMPKYQQVKALKTAHVVVATPGRLQDLMQVTNVNSSRVNQGKKRGHVSCWFDPRVSESESGRQCDETVRARAHF
eukprot:8964998-Pyramimonas_sp.AAC.1